MLYFCVQRATPIIYIIIVLLRYLTLHTATNSKSYDVKHVATNRISRLIE